MLLKSKSRNLPLARISRIRELVRLETTVAIATPFTLILKTMTKSRFRSTFRTPAKASDCRETFVSPVLRKIAASKLYRKCIQR